MYGVFGQLYHNDFNILANPGRLVERACVLRSLAGVSVAFGESYATLDAVLCTTMLIQF